MIILDRTDLQKEIAKLSIVYPSHLIKGYPFKIRLKDIKDMDNFRVFMEDFSIMSKVGIFLYGEDLHQVGIYFFITNTRLLTEKHSIKPKEGLWEKML